MSENLHFGQMIEYINAGRMTPSICEVAKKAISLLKEVSISQRSEIADLSHWIRIYKTRHRTLLQKGRACGGFEETFMELEKINGSVDLILLESGLYVSMFLLERTADILVGAIYIERDKDTINM